MAWTRLVLALALALALIADCAKENGPKHVDGFRNGLAATPVSGEKINHSCFLVEPPPPRSGEPQCHLAYQPPLPACIIIIIIPQRGLCRSRTARLFLVPIISPGHCFSLICVWYICNVLDDIAYICAYLLDLDRFHTTLISPGSSSITHCLHNYLNVAS